MRSINKYIIHNSHLKILGIPSPEATPGYIHLPVLNQHRPNHNRSSLVRQRDSVQCTPAALTEVLFLWESAPCLGDCVRRDERFGVVDTEPGGLVACCLCRGQRIILKTLYSSIECCLDINSIVEVDRIESEPLKAQIQPCRKIKLRSKGLEETKLTI